MLFRSPYGWMYPVERRLLTCKRSVRNTARPEGSIAEAYVVDECLTFCSRYFDDLDTRWNRRGRTFSEADSHRGDVSVFKHGVKFLGGSQYLDAGDDYDKMVWFVLSSCREVLPYIEYVIFCELVILLSWVGRNLFFYHMTDVSTHYFSWHGRMCKQELNGEASSVHVDKRLAKEFAGWFKKKVRSLAM